MKTLELCLAAYSKHPIVTFVLCDGCWFGIMYIVSYSTTSVKFQPSVRR